ncbi:uncharacterized protein DS421_14g479190 [Arachis hypogaea]|nr:uncharacterized protein DS421_14g479190 [Arachis hypogaea]
MKSGLMPSSSVSLRARSSSAPPTAVMPIALITGIALGIGFGFLSLRGEAYDSYRYATSSGKIDTHTPFHCRYQPFYLSPASGRDWECFREQEHMHREFICRAAPFPILFVPNSSPCSENPLGELI